MATFGSLMTGLADEIRRIAKTEDEMTVEEMTTQLSDFTELHGSSFFATISGGSIRITPCYYNSNNISKQYWVTSSGDESSVIYVSLSGTDLITFNQTIDEELSVSNNTLSFPFFSSVGSVDLVLISGIAPISAITGCSIYPTTKTVTWRYYDSNARFQAVNESWGDNITENKDAKTITVSAPSNIPRYFSGTYQILVSGIY